MNKSIFKAYDVRGIYPEDLDEEAAYKIGRSFVVFLKKENPQIVLGMDNRPSSALLFAELKRGILDQGGDVVEIGLTTSPMFYFAVGQYGYDAGINITASHNPPQYNGFKIVGASAVPISEATGLKEIAALATEGRFEEPAAKGKAINRDALSDYIKQNSENEKFNYKVVVDTANSVSGIVIPEMLNDRVRLTHLFGNLDGSFPNHMPDPLKTENMREIQQVVVSKKADLGIAFDGDGDRLLFVDEKGKIISADLVLALVASLILKKNLKAKILYDVRCSNIVAETIFNKGGTPIVSRVGHSFIKARMREEDVLFGGEYSGHYFCKNNFFAEVPFFVLFAVLREMKRTGKGLSELINPFRKYFHSGEMNFEVSDPKAAVKKFQEKYKDAFVSRIDGLKFGFEDWWLLARTSNTEPLLRIIIEAKTKILLDEKIAEVTAFIKSLS
ncbi:MAG: phosphomannomutase/phosphoglucomutase [Candidatus Pacebacteria bacterium]|nr:phosphomannomutase/phosphoglucomutase [Candidatus Paceibacterota bacterium]